MDNIDVIVISDDEDDIGTVHEMERRPASPSASTSAAASAELLGHRSVASRRSAILLARPASWSATQMLSIPARTRAERLETLPVVSCRWTKPLPLSVPERGRSVSPPYLPPRQPWMFRSLLPPAPPSPPTAPPQRLYCDRSVQTDFWSAAAPPTSEYGLCGVCQVEPREIYARPCTHIYFCAECFFNYFSDNRQPKLCPVCGRIIVSFIRTFYS